MPVNLHVIEDVVEDKASSNSPVDNRESEPIRKALWLSNKFREFAKNLRLTAENGVLILSLDDGPIEAMMLLEQIKDGKFIDNVIPAYVSVEYNGSDGPLNYLPLNNYFNAITESNRSPMGVSVFYEGLNGQPLLAGVETLLDVNRKEQISMNANFDRGIYPNMCDSINNIERNLSLELGYVYDTSESRPHYSNFLYTLSGLSNLKDKEKKVAKYFERFLNDDDFNSPLKATEQVRAGILGIVQSYDQSKITLSKLKLYDALDKNIYDKFLKKFDKRLDKSNSQWKENRNRITEILISQMENEGLISSASGQVSKGRKWGTFGAMFIDKYTEYYDGLVYK